MQKLSDNAALVEKVSKAIHLEEWCPERDRCRGTSAPSDAHARAALKVVDEHLAENPNEATP